MPLGTQYFALLSETAQGTSVTGGAKIVATVEVSKYFEDPEGLINLIYTLSDLSADDKKIVDVLLLDQTATLDPTDASGDRCT